MIEISGATSLRLTPDALRAAVRNALGRPLRRAGIMSNLCLLGIRGCLPHDTPFRPTAMLWTSAGGPRLETAKVLHDLCIRCETPMPFDFIGTQPGDAAIHGASVLAELKYGLYLPATAGTWTRMLRLAACWLENGRFQQVLCGRIEEGEAILESDWLALVPPGHGAPPLASCHFGGKGERRSVADGELLPLFRDWIEAGRPTYLGLFFDDAPDEPELEFRYPEGGDRF